jgi:3-phosphoshikimate 1-carboxyvinyltransferase
LHEGIVVPGDKSISHRALMLAALAQGTSQIHGPLTALDIRSTARVLRLLGATISPLRPASDVQVKGPRRLVTPGSTLHCGNSGTTARLMLGILAGSALRARLTGDASLRRRPMRRVTEPLAAMGARFPVGGERLPLVIQGGALRPIAWQSPIPSAQVKSAILLAGVSAAVPVQITEPVASRDHTERMLRAVGLRVTTRGTQVEFEPGPRVPPAEWHVPGDPSSAAFVIAAALLGRGGAVAIRGVGVNPTRIGFLEAVSAMGGRVAQEGQRELSGEPVADLIAAPSHLRAIAVEAESVPAMIDEIPMLACLAARAEGTSVFHGLGELRVKESDRLALLVRNLTAIGATASAEGDTLTVTGSDRPYRGPVHTGGDHRIAMAFAVLDTTNTLHIDEPASADVSFPGFAGTLALARRMVA